MSKTEPVRYTLVRHSAYDARGDENFRRAVELRSVTARQAVVVKKAGGLLFDDYTAASEREYAENYPNPDSTSMVPSVRGDFVTRAGIGEIYTTGEK